MTKYKYFETEVLQLFILDFETLTENIQLSTFDFGTETEIIQIFILDFESLSWKLITCHYNSPLENLQSSECKDCGGKLFVLVFVSNI